MDTELLSEFVEHEAIKPGNYALLHAGGKAKDYIDIDTLLEDLVAQRELLDNLEQSIIQNQDMETYDRLAFLDKDYGPVGMLPYASELSNRLETESIIIQLKRQHRLDHLHIKGVDYGDGAPLEGESLLLIDDVVTTGNTQKEAIDVVDDWGGTVKGVVCAYNRNKDGEDALEKLENDPDLDVEFTEYALSNTGCIELGVLLDDEIGNYVDIDVLEHKEELGIPEEEAEELRQESEEVVDNMTKEITRRIVDEDEVDNPSEMNRLAEEHSDSLNEETRKALEQFYTASKVFMNSDRYHFNR
jgi:orotate phosphoribosyltransferase